MRMYDIIQKKKIGQELDDTEIEFFVSGVTSGEIPDYQTSALLMAICINGMSEKETATLTLAMEHSGDTVDLSQFGNVTVDKHSTGGVGDKTSLIAAPIAAVLGCKVAKMSGRGLGHTGGTVDKLEAVNGYKTTLTQNEFFNTVQKTGMSIIGQTGNLAPADKKLYALRDVTATVDSIPLIVSSIMSKKLAAGSKNIVLDVKTGSGAFMRTADSAIELAEQMVKIGNMCGRNTAALVTDMDTPLGNAVGNALEIAEAVEVLNGSNRTDLREVCVAIAATMASLALDIDVGEAMKRVLTALDSGAALEKFGEWISAQGGDTDFITDFSRLPQAKYKMEVYASAKGYIKEMHTADIGEASVILGAGRNKKDDKIDMAAGIIINAKTGDYTENGGLLCTLYSNNEKSLTQARDKYLSAVIIGDEKPVKNPLIYKIIK